MIKRVFSMAIFTIALIALVACGGEDAQTQPQENGQSKPEETQNKTKDSNTNENKTEEEWVPEEDITFVIPYGPGGGFDRLTRALAPYLEKYLPGDAKVIPENKPGAGSLTASRQTYKGKPDGTIIQVFSPEAVIAPNVAGQTDIKLDEFVWLGTPVVNRSLLITGADSGVENFGDLENFQPIKHGVTGILSSSGLTPIVLFGETGWEYKQILHDGSSEKTLSLLRGDTIISGGSFSSELEPMQAGQTRPILWLNSEDTKPAEDEPGYELVKDLPTVDEYGISGSAFDNIRAIATVPGTPDNITSVLKNALWEAMNDPDFIKEAAEVNIIIENPMTGEETADAIDAKVKSIGKFADILKEAAGQ